MQDRRAVTVMDPALRGNPNVPRLLDRNVYVAPFLTAKGELVLFAVDRRGRCRAKAIVTDEEVWEEIETSLWDVLNEVDPPMPCLSLIQGGSGA